MESQDYKVHFEVVSHYIQGIETTPLHLMQDFANAVYSNNGLLENLVLWNKQYDGNNVIYLVKGLSRDSTGYHFKIRIGNYEFNVYTKRKSWYSFTNNDGRYITKLQTTISSVVPVYQKHNVHQSYNPMSQKTYDSSRKRKYDSRHTRTYDSSHNRTYDSSHKKTYDSSHNRTYDSSHNRTYDSSHKKTENKSLIRKKPRLNNFSSITQDDITDIHKFLDTIRNQSKLMKSNQNDGFIPVPVLPINSTNDIANICNPSSTELTTKR